MSLNASSNLNGVSFERILQRALLALYDPVEFAQSPLIKLLHLTEAQNPAQALHQILLEAVEAMKPSTTIPQQSTAWRNYRILMHRYVQQIAQRDVANSLGFSVRQLQRHEHTALLALSSVIQSRFKLNFEQPETDVEGQESPFSEEDPAFQELERLRETFSNEAINVAEIAQAALETVAPLLAQENVEVENLVPPDLPLVAIQTISLRQVFVILFSAARHLPGGKLTINAFQEGNQIRLILVVRPGSSTPFHPAHDLKEDLALATQLITLSGGSLRIDEEVENFSAVSVFLPISAQVPVLFIDDNSDTLHLFDRSLQGTHYRFIGSSNPEDAVMLAIERSPKFIVLDVMLPDVDGWEVLGRLREHPATSKIPIIVSTILPYEQLAITIGATAFLRKPVSQKDLLEMLNRLTA